MSVRTSAGILLYRRRIADWRRRRRPRGAPGPPRWAVLREPGPRRLDDPEGRAGRGHEPLPAVARREFEEETGTALDPDATLLELGSIVQKGGKVVHAWAVEGDLDPAGARSNDFEVEWPPRSGRRQRFAEIDRVEWFAPDEARRRIKPTQGPFIDRLETALRG